MNKEIPGRSLPEEQITHSLEIILNELDPFAYALVLGGSAAWGKTNNNSDIDLCVIYKPNPAEKFPLTSGSGVLEFDRHFANPEIDLIKFKTVVETQEISIDFLPQRTFSLLANFDYQKITSNYILSCLRETPSARSVYGPQHNFAGDPYYYPLYSITYENGFIAPQPLVMIGNWGEFVMGSLLDKLLVFSKVFGQHSAEISEVIAHIIDQLRDRKRFDEKLLDRPCSFAFLPSKKLEISRQWNP